MKTEIDKLDINKLVNIPTSFNNLKTKVDDLDVAELNTIPIDLKNQLMQWRMKFSKTQNSTQ